MYRDNINPRAYLGSDDEILFEKFLNPSKSEVKREDWIKEYDDTFKKFLMVGVNMPMDMKKYFCVFLMLYPMKENEQKTFFKLNDNQRVGYLNKHMIKRSRTCKVPEAVIKRYNNAKESYSRRKNFLSGEEINYIKNNLLTYTYMILEICFSNNTRGGKLDSLLDD